MFSRLAEISKPTIDRRPDSRSVSFPASHISATDWKFVVQALKGPSGKSRGILGTRGALPEQTIGGENSFAECTVQTEFFIATFEVQFSLQQQMKVVFPRFPGVAVIAIAADLDARLPEFRFWNIQPGIVLDRVRAFVRCPISRESLTRHGGDVVRGLWRDQSQQLELSETCRR